MPIFTASTKWSADVAEWDQWFSRLPVVRKRTALAQIGVRCAVQDFTYTRRRDSEQPFSFKPLYLSVMMMRNSGEPSTVSEIHNVLSWFAGGAQRGDVASHPLAFFDLIVREWAHSVEIRDELSMRRIAVDELFHAEALGLVQGTMPPRDQVEQAIAFAGDWAHWIRWATTSDEPSQELAEAYAGDRKNWPPYESWDRATELLTARVAHWDDRQEPQPVDAVAAKGNELVQVQAAINYIPAASGRLVGVDEVPEAAYGRLLITQTAKCKRLITEIDSEPKLKDRLAGLRATVEEYLTFVTLGSTNADEIWSTGLELQALLDGQRAVQKISNPDIAPFPEQFVETLGAIVRVHEECTSSYRKFIRLDQADPGDRSLDELNSSLAAATPLLNTFKSANSPLEANAAAEVTGLALKAAASPSRGQSAQQLKAAATDTLANAVRAAVQEAVVQLGDLTDSRKHSGSPGRSVRERLAELEKGFLNAAGAAGFAVIATSFSLLGWVVSNEAAIRVFLRAGRWMADIVKVLDAILKAVT